MNHTTEKLETSYTKILETSLRYGQIQKLERTMELIAQCSGRISREINLCEDMYGRSVTGERLGNQNNSDYIARYVKIKERLKRYYNNQLSKLSKF